MRPQPRRTVLARLPREAVNVVLIGANGLGKTMPFKTSPTVPSSRRTARGTLASDMLHDLAAQTPAPRSHVDWDVIPVPLSWPSTRSAICPRRALCRSLFEVVTRRYELPSYSAHYQQSLRQWNQVFPNAARVVTLVDRSCTGASHWRAKATAQGGASAPSAKPNPLAQGAAARLLQRTRGVSLSSVRRGCRQPRGVRTSSPKR